MTERQDIIKITGLQKSFGDLHVLKRIDLNIKEKEVVVIIGPSGSGKSTLLRCINYLEVPTGGEIVFDNIPLDGKANINEVRKEVGMVFQRFNLFPHMTVLENLVLAPRKVRNMGRKEAEELAMMYLKKVGLAEKANNYPDQLSGGQQQRVAIARALCMKPKAMLFDEPTSALDPEMINEVLEWRLHCGRGNAGAGVRPSPESQDPELPVQDFIIPIQNRIYNRFRTCSRFQMKPQRRGRQCKNVNDCYFMDLFACGFKTRCFAPQTAEATDGSFRLIKLRNRFLYFALPSPPLRFLI